MVLTFLGPLLRAFFGAETTPGVASLDLRNIIDPVRGETDELMTRVLCYEE